VARGLLNVNAADGAVTIGGPLLVTGDVVSAGKFGGNASGIGSAVIHGGDGVTLGNATVLGSASAVGGGLGQNANALASLKIKAETGNITGKTLTVVANAIDLGSGGQGVVTAKALSSLDAVTGNVTITGDKTLALAQAPHAISHATASADIILHAGHDLAVTGGGLLAQAEALASFAQAPDKAEALIGVTAGSDIFLGGNVTALAVAIGSHSGQSATANIFVHAGTGGFGHLALIGNLSAIASADPVNDHALASVTLIANQMLIIGANPIASAVAGGKSAFRKAHRTTGSRRNGASGTTAVARINITTDPGGLIVINDSSTGVIPSFSNPNADALQAMPIYDQTFPSGSLMAIPLSVDGKPCGALGGPGAAKGNAACHQAPINISNVVEGP
jgi:ribosomal protein S9